MYLRFLEAVPDWAIYLIFPLASWLSLAVLALVFRKLAVLLRLEEHDTDVIDTATQNAMSGVYVVLAFSLVLVVGTADNFDTDLVQEATHIESLDRLLLLEGSPQSKLIRAKLTAYAESVVQDEWKELQQGHGSRKTNAYLQDMFYSLGTLEPKDARHIALFTEILRKADQVSLSRETRVLNSQNSLPGLYWTVCYLSMLGLIIIAALRLLHATPIKVLALTTQIGMISLLFTAVLVIDYPFSGETRVTPNNIQRALKVMQQRNTAGPASGSPSS